MNATPKKWIARVLILSMANPALFIQPAMARDTDVYSGFLAESSTTIKPNILLLLDTSDSMNLPEGWREYPGAYDSHVEYLWNDLSRIVDADAGSAGEATTMDSNKISTAAIPAPPTVIDSKWGFWAGKELTDRQAIWQAARVSAKATLTGDPGARSLYRNYNDLSWIYWLPAGTDEADARLRSPSWNKFRGYIQELGNGAGGTQLRGGPNYTDTNDARIYNQCGASLSALTPSTVFVPSAVARNDGKYLAQQWARWEPYLNLTSVGNSGYPGGSTTTDALGTGTQYVRGYLDTTNPSTGNPASNSVHRDSYPGTGGLGEKGLPIRYDDGTAGAGWESIKADAGGFILRGIIDAYADQASLDVVKGWYSLPATTSDIDLSGATDLGDAKFIALKGNRDSSPAFGIATGVPSYYDVTASTCDSATGPASATCLDKQGAGTSPITLTRSSVCSLTAGTGGVTETDVASPTKTVKHGTYSCVAGTPACTGDSNGSDSPNCSDTGFDPVCATPTTANTSFTKTRYLNCARGEPHTIVSSGTCALTDNLTRVVAACPAASGGSTVTVGTCRITGGTQVAVNACRFTPSQSTLTINACVWRGRTPYYTEGVGWGTSGGSCQENGSGSYSSSNCSGVADPTRTYGTSDAAMAATVGCTNIASRPVGSYNYGGTCSEDGGGSESTTSCSVTGATSVLGAGYTNVNGTCGNTIVAGSYTYGAACTENGGGSESAASCKAAIGGTLLNIRGASNTYNMTCPSSPNKANSGAVKNQPGTYRYEQTCAGASNNTCTATVAAAFTVRGGSYTPNTCTATYPAGNYYRGGSCSGTYSPCNTVADYGGTPTVSDGTNTWYPNRKTCTVPPASGTFYNTCVGDSTYVTGVDATPLGSTTGLAANCNPGVGTPATVSIPVLANVLPPATPISCSLGTTTAVWPADRTCSYNNYTSCSNKNAVTETCTARYGAQCPTGCTTPATATQTGGGVGATHNYYRTYNFGANTDYLVHDCKADDTAAGNPGGNSYLRNITGTLAPAGTPHTSDLSTSIARTAAAYSTSSSQSVAADESQKVDMYSVNYLNWKFGPRGPSGEPIGRKTRLQIAKDVLTDVVGSINGVKIGLMSFNQREAISGNASGAHLVKAITVLDDTARNALKTSINALVAASGTPLTEALYESYLYFRGDAPYFGGSTYQALLAPSGISVTSGIDLSTNAVVSGFYKSPIEETCQANAIILVTDGNPENDEAADTLIKALPDDGTTSVLQGTTTQQFEVSSGAPYGPADTEGSRNYVLLDELAFYMANADARSDKNGTQTVKLSTVGFGVNPAVLENAASKGGHSYSANDAATLKKALEDAILAVSQWLPVGSSPAATFNTTTGTSSDIFLTAFSPSNNISWPGTVKKYQFGFGTTSCGDSTCGNPDVCMTGRSSVTYGTCGNNVEILETDALLSVELRKLRNEAVSLWIPATPADGGSGSKGGTGQVLIGKGDPADTTRTPANRNLYTYISGTTNTSLDHADNAIKDSNTLITKTLLGNAGMTDAERSELIGFAQGSNGTATSVWRTWPHYDSVHAAPTVNDFDGNTLYYLTSDGVVHAVDTSSGVERWSFMVEEGLPKITDFKADLVGAHLEVADGNPVQVVTADGKRLLVFGMRRGGRAYYAIEISRLNTATPPKEIASDIAVPKFAWKITPSQICVGASCVTDASYDELGQAWSTPAVGLVRGYKDTGTPPKLKPVLIFGGGYDTNQDALTPSADTMGRTVFVADAADGSLVHKFSPTSPMAMDYSVPADVLAVDVTGDSDGTVDRAYVGDLGGNLWRMDLDDRTTTNNPDNWTIVKLAKLATTTRPNKLFNRPTMAASVFNGQAFDAIFVGGGDTQRPSSNGANDSGAFFMVKDYTVAGVATQASSVPDAASSSEYSDTFSSDFVDLTTEVGDLTARSGDTTVQVATKALAKINLTASLKASDGYVINFSDGEKVTSYASVYAGELYFGAYLPRQTSVSESATQCVLGGYGNQYLFDALTASALRSDAGVLLYSYGSGRGYAHVSGFGVGVGIVSGGFGSGGKMGPWAPGLPFKPISNAGVRVFWYSVPER